MAAAVTNINATTSVNKPVDLQKIFTPADDTEEIRPQKNRKLYFTTTTKTILPRSLFHIICQKKNIKKK